ncbi:MAG TPA: hypothetical protein VI456_07655, partial [Polyangia bacterium]
MTSLACATLASLAWVTLAFAEPTALSDLVETREGVTIDWRAGTLTATGGAAADLRMPNVDLARPGAERRARAAAVGKLRAALAALPAGGGRKLDPDRVDRALGRVRATDVQYQSNGGAVVHMEVAFADWLDDPAAPPTVFSVREAHLAASPRAVVGGQEIALGAATYRTGAPPADVGAHLARVDHAGRLAIEGGTELAAKLARGPVLIYVQKV